MSNHNPVRDNTGDEKMDIFRGGAHEMANVSDAW